MKIYVASSWRNALQPAVVRMLRSLDHEVYDFRHPGPGTRGFSWLEIDPRWRHWSPADYRTALEHPAAIRGFDADMAALRGCDAVVAVRPAGQSTAYELGWAVGAGKRAYVLQLEPCEPELMYRGARILVSIDELFDVFDDGASRARGLAP